AGAARSASSETEVWIVKKESVTAAQVSGVQGLIGLGGTIGFGGRTGLGGTARILANLVGVCGTRTEATVTPSPPPCERSVVRVAPPSTERSIFALSCPSQWTSLSEPTGQVPPPETDWMRYGARSYRETYPFPSGAVPAIAMRAGEPALDRPSPAS